MECWRGRSRGRAAAPPAAHETARGAGCTAAAASHSAPHPLSHRPHLFWMTSLARYTMARCLDWSPPPPPPPPAAPPPPPPPPPALAALLNTSSHTSATRRASARWNMHQVEVCSMLCALVLSLDSLSRYCASSSSDMIDLLRMGRCRRRAGGGRAGGGQAGGEAKGGWCQRAGRGPRDRATASQLPGGALFQELGPLAVLWECRRRQQSRTEHRNA